MNRSVIALDLGVAPSAATASTTPTATSVTACNRSIAVVTYNDPRYASPPNAASPPPTDVPKPSDKEKRAGPTQASRPKV